MSRHRWRNAPRQVVSRTAARSLLADDFQQAARGMADRDRYWHLMGALTFYAGYSDTMPYRTVPPAVAAVELLSALGLARPPANLVRDISNYPKKRAQLLGGGS